MKLTDVRSPEGSRRRRKRVARGGKWGKTATRGANGQNSRSGGGKGPGFEGGQTPWFQRLPKFRGFNNKFRQTFQIVGLDQIEMIEGTTEITPEVLFHVELIKDAEAPVKILANGTISKALTIKAAKFSKKAQEMIEAAGGKAEVI